jgi:hypothetical protein
MIVKKKNRIERALVDIRNIDGPSPISLAKGLTGDSQHFIIGYEPTLEHTPNDFSPSLG